MLGNLPLKRKQLVAANKELIALLERGSHNAVLRFHGKKHLIEGSKDLIDLPNNRLIYTQQMSESGFHRGKGKRRV
jgi:hypothetical protein